MTLLSIRPLTFHHEECHSVGLQSPAEMYVFALGLELAESAELLVLIHDDLVVFLVLAIFLGKKVSSPEKVG